MSELHTEEKQACISVGNWRIFIMRIGPVNNIYNNPYNKQNNKLCFCRTVVDMENDEVKINPSELTEEELKVLNDRKLMLMLDDLGLLHSKVYHAYKKYFPGKVEIKPLSEYPSVAVTVRKPEQKEEVETDSSSSEVEKVDYFGDDDVPEFYKGDPFELPRPYSEL